MACDFNVCPFFSAKFERHNLQKIFATALLLIKYVANSLLIGKAYTISLEKSIRNTKAKVKF